MRHLLCFCVFLLLTPCILLADETDQNNCHDPSAWNDWEERTMKHPDDMELQTLHALWMGLCVKVERGAIKFEQAIVIFERARDALIQQRRAQRREPRQHNPLCGAIMAPDIHFTAVFPLAFASCIITMATLPYICWRTPETRFALVVSLVLLYGVLTLASLAFLRSLFSTRHRASATETASSVTARSTPLPSGDSGTTLASVRAVYARSCWSGRGAGDMGGEAHETSRVGMEQEARRWWTCSQVMRCARCGAVGLAADLR